MLKAVILIGGPQKGTRFRPLSLEVPKPLFPVAGFPMIYHHIEACSKVAEMKEILLIGFYQPNERFNTFLNSMTQQFKIPVKYLQEYTALGTAGGLYHFRDRIASGNPDMFIVMNADVCCDFPLQEMIHFHSNLPNQSGFIILGTEATRVQAMSYGCLVKDKETHEVLHYVEKPETFVSSIINCGVYLFTMDIFKIIADVHQQHQEEMISDSPSNSDLSIDVIRLEQDILAPIASKKQLYVYKTNQFWTQIKTAGSAIYASSRYLEHYHQTHPDYLAQNKEGGPTIIGSVHIHVTANIDPTAVLGPNVTIGMGVMVGPGVRIREAIVLDGATIQDHACILHSIIGWNCSIGVWSRVEGTPCHPNPNDEFAKIESDGLFDEEGRLNPSITILGRSVSVPAEVIVLNSIVLPHKDLKGVSYHNQIIL